MTQVKSKILVVDDDPDIVREIAAILRQDYEIPATASSGAAAIQEASRVRPDLVLMDIVLDGEMDGIEACREIQSRFDIPVIYLTGFSDDKTLERARISAPFGYLVKPFGARELCAAVEMVLYRHQTEKQLLEKQRWFEATLNCIGDAVVATDMHGLITFVNPPAENLTGWKSGEACGQSLVKVIRLRHENTHRLLPLPDLKSLLNDRNIFVEEPVEVILVDRQGMERPVSYRLSLIRDARNGLTGMVLSFRDMTPHRAIEKRMLTAQKMEALGKMAGSISHQFNNLLAVMAGYASSMADHLMPNSRPYDDTLKMIEAIRHARLLTKRILGITRATNPESEIKIEPVPLGQAVRNTIALIEKNFADRHITFKVIEPDQMPVVMADSDQVLDVLMDLFMNSADALPEGGAITIEAERKRVRKPDQKINPHAKPGLYGMLSIRDTGRGFSAEVLEHIFEIFFTTREPGLRIGFGLFAAQHAVQRYGGWIRAASKPRRGTTFTLFIPEFPRRQKSRAARKDAAMPRILIVDDRPETLAEMETVLKSAHYQIEKAHGGEEAIALINDHGDCFALSIIDVIMPGKDGKMVLQTILDQDATASVIMTSGFSRDYVRSVLPPGAWRFIQKPFDNQQLLGAVARALEQRMSPSA